MYSVGMLGSYLTQGVYAIAGPLQPFGGAVDIIVVQQEDGTFKSSPWYVKFGDFQGNQEKVVHIAVNDCPADFHMCLDSKGEAYFEKEVEPDEAMALPLPSTSSSSGEDTADSETEVPAGTSMGSSSCLQEPLVATASTLDFKNIANEVTESLDDRGTESDIHKPPSMCHGGSLDAHDRKVPNIDAPASLETEEVLTMEAEYTGEAKVDNDSLCTTNSVNMTAENSSGHLEELQGDSIETTRHEGGQVSNMTFRNIEILENSSYSEDDGSCVKSVMFQGIETRRECCNDLSIDNKVVMDETAEEDTIDLCCVQADHQGNGGVNSDVTLDDDGNVDDFEGGTVESVGNAHVFDDRKLGVLGNEHMNRDLLAMDSDKLVSGDISSVLMAASESNTSSLEEGGGKLAMESSKDSTVQDPGGLVSRDARELVLATSESGAFLLEEKGEELNIDNSKEAVDGDDAGNQPVGSSSSRWSLWPLLFRRSRAEKGSLSASSASNQVLMEAAAASANMPIESPFTEEPSQKNGYSKTKVRTYVPTSAQLASLRLEDGPNKVTFTFSKARGKTEVDARIYLWKWSTRIVVSDVDGTITKSDVLGQVMPLVGRDWSQYGVTRLFSAIKDNGFEVLFLSARAISQAYLTRRFLLNLKQDGEALPEGPVFISPDGLIPSLYREVVRRAPHEFKISCLEGIRELFPKDVNPFYAGFGNRETDEISYLKVGIPRGKIFIINPKGEVVVNHRVDCKSYTSLHSLVDDMFPPMSSHEQEDFNAWNFWKMPLPDIDDELNAKGSKNAKRGGSLKK